MQKDPDPDIAETTVVETIANPENEVAQTTLLENEKETENTPVSGLSAINDQGDYIFNFSEGISTKMNTTEVSIPGSLTDFKYKLFTYTLEHPDKELHIESLYSPKENVMNPNLGIQRGERIKKILVEAGIHPEKIVIKPEIVGINTIDSFWKDNCIQFSFHPLDEERVKELRTVPESMIIYPRYNNSGILANSQLKELVEEISDHVSNNPDLMIEVIGHTDNIGSGIDNYKMGLKYANQVRWYLINKGEFDPNQITASSRGEEEPIESNETSSGRLANRRIEIKFK
jgi:outer membrane protein OmpA-like peptidoglycan-associated protein